MNATNTGFWQGSLLAYPAWLPPLQDLNAKPRKEYAWQQLLYLG